MHWYCEQTATNQYCDWKLRVIYEGDGGVVGLTTDGKLGGDGIYESVDFLYLTGKNVAS